MNIGKLKKRIMSINIIFILITAGFIGMLFLNGCIKDGEVEAASIIVDCKGLGNFSKIQDAIDYANSGDIIYVWAGIYYEKIIVDKSITLIGNGTSNTIINGSGRDIVLKITSDWVNISEFTINNGGTGNGIMIYYSDNCKIQNCNFSNNDFGINLYYSHYNILKNNTCTSNKRSGIHLRYSNYNIINNNSCNSNVYNGIYLEYSSNNTIKNNKCCLTKWDGIELFRSSYNEVKSNYCSDNINGIEIRYSLYITMLNNIMDRCGLYIWGDYLSQWNTHSISSNNSVNGKPFYYFKNINDVKIPSSAGQIILANCTNIIIQNQKIENTSVGISLAFSSNNMLKNNNCSNNYGGIYLFRSSNNSLINNTFISNKYCSSCLYHDHSSGYGIKSRHSKDNLLENNYNQKNSYGIDLDYSDSHLIVNNTCSNGYIGISIDSSNLNTIDNNTCVNNEYGIFLYWTKSNTVINNSCILNKMAGLYFWCARSGVFKFNYISRNKWGIELQGIDVLNYDSNYNIIVENNISYNTEIGIYIPYTCKNNKLFHNNFISNVKQAFDEGKNFWNNSAQEGNYWSDYNGSDDGSNGRIIGDGIGDTNIPHLNLDNYPFIKPSGWLYPGIPILIDPGDFNTSGNYTLFWNKTRFAHGYVLEEANSEKFKSSSIIYNGYENMVNITSKNVGTYFYRVKAYNNDFESIWSNHVDINVINPPNLPPQINQSIKNIRIFEDMTIIGLINLNDWFIDPEGDDLIFKVKSTKNSSVKILDNGSIEFTPKKDWNGKVTIIFTANDTVNEVEDNLNVTVVGVNDPPEKPDIIEPLNGKSFLNSTKINFTGYCYDVDEIYGDILNYTWISNISGIIGESKTIENITLPLGYHNILLKVTDLMNEFNQTNISINIYNLSSNKISDMDNITNNLTDTDNDMIPDNWEQKYGLNITDPIDAELDFDEDDLTNLEEYLNQTNPLDSDTDNDSYNDGLEVDKNTDPLDDEDYPIYEDKEKESKKFEIGIYLLLIEVIIIIFILLTLYIKRREKKDKD